MVNQKNILILIAFLLITACGVKKSPTPLYGIPQTALQETPTPSPSPSPR